MDVSGGSTDNYLLTGLQNGDSYTISIVARSQHLSSENVTADMDVGLGEKSMYTHKCALCSKSSTFYEYNIKF